MTAAMLVLEPIFEADLPPEQYAYRLGLQVYEIRAICRHNRNSPGTCRGVADSLEEAGERLFTFLRYAPQQWKSLRTTSAIERLHGEFKRRVKTQCALPNA